MPPHQPVRADAAIFDLDGTLLDSLDVWADIDVAFLSKRGFEVPAHYINEVSARSMADAAAYTISHFGLDETPEDLIGEWRRMAVRAYSEDIRCKPGVLDYLSSLRASGVRMAVATSLPHALLLPVLRSNGILGFFEVIRSVEDVGQGKESPALFLDVIERLKVRPERCLIFEDVFAALCSAKRTGAMVCGVYDKYSEDFSEQIRALADFYIRDFREAPVLLAPSDRPHR